MKEGVEHWKGSGVSFITVTHKVEPETGVRRFPRNNNEHDETSAPKL